MSALILLIMCFVLCFTMCFVSDNTLPTLSHFTKQRCEDDILIFFNVLMMGTLIWPLLFMNVFKNIEHCPWILIGLLWPIGLGMLQMYDMYYDRCEEIKDHHERRSSLIGGIHLDTSTIISFAFACATFFWAIGNLGNKEKLIPAARVILTVLLICVGFIIPTEHIVDNSQRYSLYIRAMQRVAMNYMIGLLITALIIVITNCVSNYDPQLRQTSSKQTNVLPPR
jgi:hypothetical protein